MPKISEERRAERREQILGAARRCFAEHGYEGATVARLEEATGLSRGAIFNYFPSKEELFVELAVEDSRRISDLWVNQGLAAVVGEVLELDPAWLGVYLELVRRVRTDRGVPPSASTSARRRSSPSTVRGSRRRSARASSGTTSRLGTSGDS